MSDPQEPQPPESAGNEPVLPSRRSLRGQSATPAEPDDATQAFTPAEVAAAAEPSLETQLLVPGQPGAPLKFATPAAPAAPATAATTLLPAAAVESSTPITAASGGGIGGSIRRHPTAWLFSALGLVFLLLGTGAVFAGIAVGAPVSAVVVPSGSPTPSAPAPRPTPSNIAAATTLRTCSIAGQASSSGLGTFEGSVINATTGEVLFDRGASTPIATASVMKVLTSAAALITVGPGYRFTTSVYEDTADPGTVVLVGGGDPTLSALSSGQESVYQGAPKLQDLAAKVNAAWSQAHQGDGLAITKVVADASLWNPTGNAADAYDPSWPANERTLGYQPLIYPLMVDGDRANPKAQTSPRGTDPVQTAGDAFASYLGAGITVTKGSPAHAAQPLGQVQSQPISTLIGQMLPPSDNTLAEMMVRIVSKTAGGDGSAASLATVIPKVLNGYGIDTTGIVIKDGSGESNVDAVPPLYIAKLMTKVLAGGQGLDTIYNALPISGKTGTLASRFTGANAVARGAVNAKTGSIANLYGLAGIVHSKDGTPLAFAFFAKGNVTAGGAYAALDTVTTAVFNCGNNLSNN